MDLLPTSEQQQIIDNAAAFIGDRLPLSRLRGLLLRVETPSPETWKQLSDLGWLALGLEASAGGVGYGPMEEVLLFRELGRVVAPPRILFTVAAAHAAAAAGDTALAERLSLGAAPVALAVREDFNAPSGTIGLRRVYETEGATVALAIDGDDVWLLDISSAALPLRPCLDSSISMSVADLDALPVLCHVTDPAIGLRAALLLSAYQVGSAETAVEMIVDYAKVRQTFGRPIGAYQAVRHPCAEMSCRAVEARALVFLASVSLSDGAPDAALQISAACALAEAAARQNADDNIQLHGGIGVTAEFDAHHLIKRAVVSAQWFGDRRSHLARVLSTPISLEVAS